MPSRFVVLRAFIDTTGLPREQRLWLPVLIDALFEVRVSGGGTLACEGLWPAAHPLMNDTGVGTAAPVRWRCQTPIHRPGEAVLSLEQVVRQLDVDTVAHNAALGVPGSPGLFACGPFAPWLQVVIKAEVPRPRAPGSRGLVALLACRPDGTRRACRLLSRRVLALSGIAVRARCAVAV